MITHPKLLIQTPEAPDVVNVFKIKHVSCSRSDNKDGGELDDTVYVTNIHNLTIIVLIGGGCSSFSVMLFFFMELFFFGSLIFLHFHTGFLVYLHDTHT